MINLDMLDPAMFSNRNPEVRQHYELMVSNPTDPRHGTFNDKSLRYTPLPKGNPTNWPFKQESQFNTLANIINLSLDAVTQRPKKDSSGRNRRGFCDPADFSQMNNPCGFFSTVRQRIQKPHTDTDPVSIAAFKKFAKRNELSEHVLPYHMIIPLSKCGRYIFFYGVQGDEHFRSSPILIWCPQNCAMFWRSVMYLSSCLCFVSVSDQTFFQSQC